MESLLVSWICLLFCSVASFPLQYGYGPPDALVNLQYEPPAPYQHPKVAPPRQTNQISSSLKSPSDPSPRSYEPNGFVVDRDSTSRPLEDRTQDVGYEVYSGPPSGETPGFSGQPRSGGSLHYEPPAPYQQEVPQPSSSPSEPSSQSYKSNGFIVDSTSGPETVGPLVDSTQGVGYGVFSGQPRSGGYGPPAPYQQEVPKRSSSSLDSPSELSPRSYEPNGFIVDSTSGPETVGPLVDPTQGVGYGVISGPPVRETLRVSGQPRSGGYVPPTPYQQPEEIPHPSSSSPEGPSEPSPRSYESNGFIVDPTSGPETVDPTQDVGFEVFSGPPAVQPRSGGYGPPAPYHQPEQGGPAGSWDSGYSVYSGHEAPVALINLQPVSVVGTGGNSTAGHTFTTNSHGGGSDPAAQGLNTAAPGAAPETYNYFQPSGSGQLEGSQPAGGDDSSFYDPTYEPNSFVAPEPSNFGSRAAFRWVTMPAGGPSNSGYGSGLPWVAEPAPNAGYDPTIPLYDAGSGPGLPWVLKPAGGAAEQDFKLLNPPYDADSGPGLPWVSEPAKGAQDEIDTSLLPPEIYITKSIGDFQRVYELTSHTSYDPDLYLEIETESEGGTKV